MPLRRDGISDFGNNPNKLLGFAFAWGLTSHSWMWHSRKNPSDLSLHLRGACCKHLGLGIRLPLFCEFRGMAYLGQLHGASYRVSGISSWRDGTLY